MKTTRFAVPYAVLAGLAAVLWPARAPSQADATAPQGVPVPAPEPPSPPPAQAPPAPPPPTATAPEVQPPRAAAPVPPGEWVYTQQYGWIWMSYGDAYTYVPPGGTGEPLAYVYARPYGWRWVVAPWVWGIGPWPRFGPRGPAVFGWYRHGWWRTPARWRFRPAPPRRDFAGHAHGVRPAPHRGERREHRSERPR